MAKVLQLYAADRADYGREISQKATKLLQRWQVSVFELSYQYDEEGLHELRHKELRRKLEVVRKSDKNEFLLKKKRKNEKESTLQVGPYSDAFKVENTRTAKEDELIRKAPNGRFIMFKSNFDFMEKPKGYLDKQILLDENERDSTRLQSSDRVVTAILKRANRAGPTTPKKSIHSLITS